MMVKSWACLFSLIVSSALIDAMVSFHFLLYFTLFIGPPHSELVFSSFVIPRSFMIGGKTEGRKERENSALVAESPHREQCCNFI